MAEMTYRLGRRAARCQTAPGLQSGSALGTLDNCTLDTARLARWTLHDGQLHDGQLHDGCCSRASEYQINLPPLSTHYFINKERLQLCNLYFISKLYPLRWNVIILRYLCRNICIGVATGQCLLRTHRKSIHVLTCKYTKLYALAHSALETILQVGSLRHSFDFGHWLRSIMNTFNLLTGGDSWPDNGQGQGGAAATNDEKYFQFIVRMEGRSRRHQAVPRVKSEFCGTGESCLCCIQSHSLRSTQNGNCI